MRRPRWPSQGFSCSIGTWGAGGGAAAANEENEANATVQDPQGLVGGNNPDDPDKIAALRAMSDSRLLDAVRRPLDGAAIALYRGSNVIANGNHCAAELLRRAADPLGSITYEAETS